jgi:hypothetical protein
MSVHVMGLCFRAKFGSPYLKAVAVALADHASDDGSKIWPSVETLSDKTEIAVRTVQYKLRDLEAMGLIVCVDEGGKGAKDTREYKFDMGLLKGLAEGEIVIKENDEEGATDAPIEGAGRAPFILVRVQPTTGRVQPTTNKGAPDAPEPSLNHPEPSLRASAREDLKYDLNKEEKAGNQPARASIIITPKDPSWSTWIDFLEGEHPVKAQAARHWQMLTADSRWPNKAKHWSVKPLPRDITGEAA